MASGTAKRISLLTLAAAGALSGCSDSSTTPLQVERVAAHPSPIAFTKVLRCWDHCQLAQVAVYIARGGLARRVFEHKITISPGEAYQQLPSGLSTGISYLPLLSGPYAGSIAVSATGRFIAYWGVRSQVHLVDLRSHRNRILGQVCAQFSPDGRYLAFMPDTNECDVPEGDLKVMDLQTGRTITPGKLGPFDYEQGVNWSYSGNRLAWVQTLRAGFVTQVASIPVRRKSTILSFRNGPNAMPTFSWDGQSVLTWDYWGYNGAEDVWYLMKHRIRGAGRVKLAQGGYDSDGYGTDLIGPVAMRGHVLCDLCAAANGPRVAFVSIGSDGTRHKVRFPKRYSSGSQVLNYVHVSPDGREVLVGWGPCDNGNCPSDNYDYGIWRPGMKAISWRGQGMDATWLTSKTSRQ